MVSIFKGYGIKYFGLLCNIEKTGLIFTSQSGQSSKIFNQLSQKFNLLVDNVQEDNPNDIAYVFSGYAPLSVRFCQYLTRPNWKQYGDLFGLLPGSFIEEQQRLPNGIRKRSIPFEFFYYKTINFIVIF